MTNEKLKAIQKASQFLWEAYNKAVLDDPANETMRTAQSHAALLTVTCEVARRLPPPLDDEE